MNLNLTKEQQTKLDKKLKSNKQTLEQYLTSLVLKDIEGKYDLGKGFYYDLESNRLFNKKDEVVLLSKLENSILKYLILVQDEDQNRKVSAEELYDKCWDRRKEFSIFTVRNFIKRIRDKTHYDIINNTSNVGYSIYPN
ncbi:winged helix-turn-helix domain-containing protein [Halarcobacter sp.]|uniref:winged helix-turn-helix domain-containing protein n=1 Tax=Halarcobacter sp. TaxID=2321133 RepID=UPI003A90DBE3